MHPNVLHNDQIRDAKESFLSPGQVGLLAGWGIFTTMRVYNGVLFAFERHFARMKRDAELLRIPFPADPQWMKTRLLDLIQANRAKNSTLRVYVVRNRGGVWEGPDITRDFDLIGFSADLKDWGTSVTLALAPEARHAGNRFTGTKVLSWAYNLALIEEAQAQGFDEVLLLNERGQLSECTSANIFLVEGDRVSTPPLQGSGCLPGVTREVLLTEIKCSGITIQEKDLLPADMEEADQVFITSTTRDLLSVRAVEGLKIRRQPPQSGSILQTLNQAFGRYRAEYCTGRSTEALPATSLSTVLR